jgi:hypothetical protein
MERESEDGVNTSESAGSCSTEVSRYISPGTTAWLPIVHVLHNMAVRLAATVIIVVAVVLPGVLSRKIRKCFSLTLRKYVPYFADSQRRFAKTCPSVITRGPINELSQYFALWSPLNSADSYQTLLTVTRLC